MIKFVQDNWGIIASVLLGVSELLGNIPSVKSNSVFQLLFSWLQKQKK